MSRIRSVHPGLFTDEAFMQASAYARLAIIGIWTEAFDDGVFAWKPIVLKARIFPADTCNMEDILSELERLEMVKRVEREGKSYGLIRNFCKFQRPKKPNSSGVKLSSDDDYTGKAENQSTTGSEPIQNQSPNSSAIPALMEDGGDNRKEEKENARERASASPSGFDEFWNLYPNKVGNDAAVASYRKALKRASHTEIIEGLRRYRAKTDDRPWCNPATWLNQGRWADQPAGVGSLPVANSGDPVRETVFVEIDTPAWRAWAAHRGRSPPTRDLRTPAGIKRGWDFETEFPDMEGARA